MLENKEYAEALHLTEITSNEELNNARALALRSLASGAPIPKTLLTKVEWAARNTEEKTL